MFTDIGKNMIIDWLDGNNPTQPTHIALGSGSVAETVNDSGLNAEIDKTRKSFDSTTTSNKSIEYEHVLNSTEPSGLMPVNVFEIGLFNGSPTGSLFARSTSISIEKTTDVELLSIIGVRIK